MRKFDTLLILNKNLSNGIFKKNENGTYTIQKHPYIDGHTISNEEKEKKIVPGVVSAQALIEYFGIDYKNKKINISFPGMLSPGDTIDFKQEGNKYMIEKDNKTVLVLETKEGTYSEAIDFENTNTELYKTMSNKGKYKNTNTFKVIKLIDNTGQIFQKNKFKLTNNAHVKFQKEGEISIGDKISTSLGFKKDEYPDVFLAEIVAQTGSLAVAHILDKNNDDKGKILTLDNLEFSFLNNIDKDTILNVQMEVTEIDKRNITIKFSIFDSADNKVIANGLIKGKQIMKKLLLR